MTCDQHPDNRPVTTQDAFLGDGLCILQPASGYRAGIDAVLLAATVTLRDDKPQAVLDVGTGVGTVGLCVAHRNPAARVTMVESEKQLANLAQRNIAANDLCNRVRAICADVTAPASTLRDVGLDQESFDLVLANPPYHDDKSGTAAASPLKQTAHAMNENGLDDWLRFITRMLKPGGKATLIHKADALDRVISAIGNRLGGLMICPVYPRADQPANRILVRGTKGSRAGLKVLPGLILHTTNTNEFTPQLQAILRNGAGLDLDATTTSTKRSRR